MKKGLRRAGIVGLSTLVATSLMSIGAVTAQANWAPTGGGIGLVDTSPAPGTQGAVQVLPGVSGQAIGDVRLLIPNTFVNGDTIDLTVFDRTATATNAGTINSDVAHTLGFIATPTVAVNATPWVSTTTIGPVWNTPNNTEGVTGNRPIAAAAGAATTAPVFATSLVASSRANGLATDIIRLRIAGVASAGTDPTAKWLVTLSGLTANVGSAVSPGELRVVPFAYNGAPTTTGTNASLMFDGNEIDQDGLANTYDPAINLYTVPAYVSPVSFNIGAPNNIVADGSTQAVGNITIAETNNFSLQNGDYTVDVGSAVVENNATNPITVTGAGLAAGETVVKSGADNVIQFTIAGASNTSKLSVTLSGLLLSDTTKGPISYTLTGGSIDNNAGHSFLVTAGTSLDVPLGAVPPAGVLADVVFSPGVNQADIEAPSLTVNAVSTPLALRIGGNDRYETAAKIALNNGANDYVVLASGQNFPDALSSAYLANQIGGGSILLTRTASLPVTTASAMRELGTRTVFIAGGTGAVSAAVEAQLKATPQYYPGGLETVGQGKLHVVRLGGADRYMTNKIMNQYGSALTGLTVGRTQITFGQATKATAIVATGQNFPDALAAGPATAGGGFGAFPIILTHTSSLDAAASSQMTNLDIQQAVIVGGTGAVSAGVATSIDNLPNVDVVRIGGADRYATATLIADFERAPVTPTATRTGGLGFTGADAFLATGVVFADALAGAPLAGGLESPILLTTPTTLSAPTQVWLKTNAAFYDHVIALGLGGAVSNAVLAAANAAVSGL